MIQNQPGQNQTPQPSFPHSTPPSYTPPRRAAKRLKKPEGWNGVASTVIVLLIAPLVALFLTTFVFQSYQVDGPSMETTLYNNDRLLVWKVPKTWSRITGNAYIPKRGDVVIFVEGTVGNATTGKQLIKRVIGLPGERVVVKNNTVKVYNDAYPDGFEPDKTLPYGDNNTIPETRGDVDMVVPKDTVFVLGDNRSNSLDSRAFGPVASRDIVGKLVLRVWPVGEMKAF